MDAANLEAALRDRIEADAARSDDDLMHLLGRQIALASHDPSARAASGSLESLEALESLEQPEGLETGWFLDIGRSLVERVEPLAFNLFCGADPEFAEARRELARKIADLGDDKSTLAAAVAVKLVAMLGLSQSVAAVVALIVVRHVFERTVDGVCHAWTERLGARAAL